MGRERFAYRWLGDRRLFITCYNVVEACCADTRTGLACILGSSRMHTERLRGGGSMAMKLKESKTPRWTCAATVICGLAGVVAWSLPVSSRAQEAHATRAMEITLDPDSPGALRTPTVGLTHQERESLLARKRQLERDAAAATRNDPPSPAGLPAVEGQGTDPVAEDDSRFPFAPGSLIIVRNNLNPPTTSQSTLAEPAAANNAANVLATGNFSHYEFSLNGGVTWTKTVFPAGPAAAPFSCCDNDVIHDRGRGVTFMSALYTNAALTNGAVRIFVFRNINTLGFNCSYTISPSGAAANILPDYPKIGKSNSFLYLTLNNIGPGGQAQIWRFNIDNIADCVTAAGSVVNLNDRATVGQRVVTPAEGAKETQYFSWAENSTQIRIFSWPESSAAPSSVLRTISASTFTNNPDCRGGTLNNNFADDLWASIQGFNRWGAVGKGRVYFYWNVGADAVHTQAHVHSAIFDELSTGETGLNLLAETPMFITNNAQCNGLPIISTNDRGDLGLSTAIGGRAGGGGPAARGFVGIADDFSGGIGFFPTVALTAGGTANRTDARYGDYFRTHPHSPCGDSWIATNYALNGGIAVANVNSRYIEFGRGRDVGCNFNFLNTQPAAP